jgi:hypothetical protein
MKKTPVKKKPQKKPDKKAPVKEFTILKRRHLLGMLDRASDEEIRELYQQVMGAKDTCLSELGHVLRDIMHQRKYGSSREEDTGQKEDQEVA